MIIMESYSKMRFNVGLINKDILRAIKSQEMDRKDFLKYCGLVLLGLVGFKTLVSLLEQADKQILSGKDSKKATRGFGSGKYGA